jgi:hypothetical protein
LWISWASAGVMERATITRAALIVIGACHFHGGRAFSTCFGDGFPAQWSKRRCNRSTSAG